MKFGKSMSMLLIVAIVFASTSAQTNYWTSVSSLPKGSELIVERKNGDRVLGSLLAAGEDTITLTSAAGSYIIGKDNVRKIYHALPTNKMKHANRGALLGGVLGFALGLGVASAQDPASEAMPGPTIFIAGGLVGGLVGGWMGSRRAKGKEKGELIYVAN